MAEEPKSNTSQPGGKEPAQQTKVTPVIKTLKKPDSASAANSPAPAEKKEEAKTSPSPASKAASTSKKKKPASKKKPAAKTKAANNNKTKTSKTPAKSAVKATPKKKPSPAKSIAKAATIAKSQTQSQTQFMETIMNTVNSKNFEKISQETANASRENMEALQKFASAYAQGCQDCISTYADMVQKSVEKQSKLYKDMLGKKTINEVTETLQSASQENLNELLANATKLSEQAVKVCMTSFEPINAQLNKNIKKASQKASEAA